MAKSKESFTRTESVARWSREGRAAYEAEREALLFDLFRFFFLNGVRCSNQAGNEYTSGDGDFFYLSEIFGFIFIVFAVLLCFRFRTYEYRHTDIQHIKSRKKYPTWGMYIRTTCERA